MTNQGNDEPMLSQEQILDELVSMCIDQTGKEKKRPFQGENEPRVSKLGFMLYEIGGDDGHELMCTIRDQLPEEGQRDLEYVWKHIGDWD